MLRLPIIVCLLMVQAFSGIVLSAFFAGYAATQVLGGAQSDGVSMFEQH
jgi:hypothetical protein